MDKIWARTQAEHDKDLPKRIHKVSAAGVHINAKCVFSVPELTFLKVVIANCISQLKNKIKAVILYSPVLYKQPVTLAGTSMDHMSEHRLGNWYALLNQYDEIVFAHCIGF